jgi:hypothetical protein
MALGNDSLETCAEFDLGNLLLLEAGQVRSVSHPSRMSLDKTRIKSEYLY